MKNKKVIIPLLFSFLSSCHKYNVSNVPTIDVIDYKYKVVNDITLPNHSNEEAFGFFDVSLFFTECNQDTFYFNFFDTDDDSENLKDIEFSGTNIENLTVEYSFSKSTYLMSERDGAIDQPFISETILTDTETGSEYKETEKRFLIQKQLFFSVKANREFKINEFISEINRISFKYFNRTHSFDAKLSFFYDGSNNNSDLYKSLLNPRYAPNTSSSFSTVSKNNTVTIPLLLGTASNITAKLTSSLDFDYLDGNQIIINNISFLKPICKIKKLSFFKDYQLNTSDNYKDSSIWNDIEPYMSFDSFPNNPIVVELEKGRYYNLLVLEIEKTNSYPSPLLNYYSNLFNIDYIRNGTLSPGSYTSSNSIIGERHNSLKELDYGADFRKEVCTYINENYPLNVYPYTNLFPKDIKDKDAEKAYESSYTDYFNSK